MLRKLILTLQVLLLAAAAACAQEREAFDPDGSRDEIAFSVGLMTPLQRGADGMAFGADATWQLDYSHFWRSGVGVRTGLLYLLEYTEFDNVFGVPVALVWRTAPADRRTRIRRGMSAAGSTLQDGLWNGPVDGGTALQSGLAAFLMNLFSRAEFYAGLTPGYVPGAEDIRRISYADGGWYESGMRKPCDVSLTADAGMALSYRIWRFNLRFAPGIHYSLLNNYRDYSARFESNYPAPKITTRDLRWHFSFQFGISFML